MWFVVSRVLAACTFFGILFLSWLFSAACISAGLAAESWVSGVMFGLAGLFFADIVFEAAGGFLACLVRRVRSVVTM